jgi:hypothetical protein
LRPLLAAEVWALSRQVAALASYEGRLARYRKFNGFAKP